ncbi:putative Histidine acid phosphatase [Taphrina deformans PYCC 5710]|uniref:Histidine acid phosphatase n=1 Tax=Taphrina deformans (strain PYCC 5710 / ATCC 11124 / CBS 356.35 / IMI 108563 / JCM 9778 / NBRC 8474) TaxID=1097556 RepID=R4XJU4_TAPDE|nr:putative Histidine acid phosphatase [Taphrina deformans PYCC 5710]|eukprot:CCG83617.1 putative Histidine acid phosphatase [Taphrina deformans PYCC 5710]
MLFPLVSALLLPHVQAAQVPFRTLSHTEGYKFDPLLHLPGISPYFDAIGSGLSHEAPVDCKVTAASYLIRHAAIYANDDDYEKYIEPFLKKLDQAGGKGFHGSFSFLKKWKTPIDDPKKQLEEITPQGIKDAKKVGKHLLSRYPRLVPTVKHIYADKKSRTQDTAEALAGAFPQSVEVKVISSEASFHAQIPHKYCDAFTKEPGNKELAQFIDHYTLPIIRRISELFPFTLEPYDIIGMQQLCGYESAINGKISKFCPAFTDDEWMSYEYAWDLKYSFMVGHGNPLSPYLGFPWLNVTSALFSKFHEPSHHEDSITSDIPNDDGQRFFLSTTHREVVPFIATALGLFNSSSSAAEEFPLDGINWSRSWRMAELIPFLGHIGIEKVTCRRPGLHQATMKKGEVIEEYVRIIANSAPRPIPACQSGPGASCPVHEFTDLVDAGMREYGDFHGVCDIKKEL